MTEEEARTKWCPFSRMDGSNRSATLSADGQSWKGMTQNPEPCRCIGSACMAWRSLPGPIMSMWRVIIDGVEEPRLWSWDPTKSPNYPGKTIVGKRVVQAPTGFCGLAGASQ